MATTAIALETTRAQARRSEEHTFTTSDGVRLFFRYWPAVTAPAQGAVVLLHRGHEHSGRVAHLVDEFDLPHHAFFALDARAHGRSGGEQGPGVTMSTFVQDLDEFVRAIRADFGLAEEQLAVVAQSLAAVIAAAWVHDYAPKIRCLVLASPAFRVKLYVPFARPGLALMHAAAGDFFVQSYVQGNALTRDAARAASYATDPLIKRPISVGVLLSLDALAARLIDDAGAIRVPVQMLVSGSDWVVRRQPQRAFYERLGSAHREWHVLEGFRHDTLGERDRHLAVAPARDFLLRSFPPPSSLRDGSELTRAEHARLSAPLPWYSPKALSFAAQRLFMRTLGRASAGMRLGHETGFDSGASLDYVYRNQATGFTPVGRLIDWFYLNAIGWRGIRVRKQMIMDLFARAVREIDGPVRVLDVAAGQGRYVLDALPAHTARVESVILRDFAEENVKAGQAAVRARGLTNVRFEQGDAFAAASLAAVQPRVNLALVSGLYELFPDNEAVSESLRGIAAAVEPGGFLLYTGQPWHPQLEMIARTLTSHRGGAAWVMRRRTQEELDALVEAAGFRKVEQRIDPTGLFTVSRAERV